MPTLNTYLTFAGNCEQAFNFYRDIFGGEFQSFSRFGEMPPMEEFPVPEEDENLVMHVSLPISSETILMGSDSGSERASQLVFGTNFSISVNADSREQADSFFGQLSEGGQVTMPLGDTFWGSYYGMCTDKFGVNWMVSFASGE